MKRTRRQGVEVGGTKDVTATREVDLRGGARDGLSEGDSEVKLVRSRT